MGKTRKEHFIIGLTGPIASGKDEVCSILKKMGARVIDADEIGHKVMMPQSDVWHKLVRTFGSKILMSGGRVDRKKLGELVFYDPKLMNKLNKIIHPKMKEEIIRESRQPSVVGRKLIVINAAVLREIGLIPFVHEVWAVLAGKKQRLARLERRGMKKDRALAVMRSQASDSEYKKFSDRVITNNGTKKDLKAKVEELFAA